MDLCRIHNRNHKRRGIEAFFDFTSLVSRVILPYFCPDLNLSSFLSPSEARLTRALTKQFRTEFSLPFPMTLAI